MYSSISQEKVLLFQIFFLNCYKGTVKPMLERINGNTPIDDLVLWKETEILDYGIDLFNKGEFYRCHDVMEHLWGFGDSQLRSFYQGLLHLAVAMYHLSRDNTRGAKTLLDSGTGLLQQYRPCFRQVDIARLIEATEKIRKDLENNSYRKGVFLRIEKKEKRR